MTQISATTIFPDGNSLPAPLGMLAAELQKALRCYWNVAKTILDGSTVHLIEPDTGTFSLERNFFSALFMYSYYRAGIAEDRRILYASVNQCLRGMVTGCDNILDDEYKKTLETDLPVQAHRFRSVLDIMVSDRALFKILLDYCRLHNLPLEQLVQASCASLHSLLLSGAQEASEEGGINERLLPEEILAKVHHFKTGVLFQCTWAIPKIFEQTSNPEGLIAQEALYDIGIGCQILDDMVDLFVDLREKHHNYVASVIFHEEPPHVWQELEIQQAAADSAKQFYADNLKISCKLKTTALHYLEGGMRRLFFDQHQYLVEPAMNFIAERIGIKLQ